MSPSDGRSKVLVAGGAGYVGSHTCKALAAAGFVPVVYDRLSTGHRGFVRWGPLVEGDLLDRETLARAFAGHRPAVVLHFAACTGVGESVEDPARYYRNNVVGALNLMDAARAQGAVPIVFSSSCAVYGAPAAVPVREDAPLAPVNPYGHTKLAVERALCDYDEAYGLRSVRLRYFNACGADPDAEIGERRDRETHLVPRAILAATGRLPELAVFGDDYPTPDGTPVRDYVHCVRSGRCARGRGAARARRRREPHGQPRDRSGVVGSRGRERGDPRDRSRGAVPHRRAPPGRSGGARGGRRTRAAPARVLDPAFRCRDHRAHRPRLARS